MLSSRGAALSVGCCRMPMSLPFQECFAQRHLMTCGQYEISRHTLARPSPPPVSARGVLSARMMVSRTRRFMSLRCNETSGAPSGGGHSPTSSSYLDSCSHPASCHTNAFSWCIPYLSYSCIAVTRGYACW
jgi:hypothetical protein